ncbi:MAG: hypothetical protein WA888_15665 [Burkholderiaceae bacterium]
MHSFQALRVDSQPIDQELRDAGAVGPELAHLASVYCESPRALVFHQPSSEWRLFMVLLPLASRLSLMGNPVFSQLARAWGLNLRFIGVDRNGLVYDFRSLLSDDMLSGLIQWLQSEEMARYDSRSNAARTSSRGDKPLDILFASLSRDMLTILDKRRDDWGRHLDSQHQLEPGAASSLFDRASRYPDFLAACHEALRSQMIDVRFYGRLLRSVDLREDSFEQRAAAQIDDCLDPIMMTRLAKSDAGKHLGCYNWLSIAPRNAPQRAHILSRLPFFASFFAEALLPIDTWTPHEQGIEDLYSSIGDIDELMERDAIHANQGGRPSAPAYDLKRVAARQETARNMHVTGLLRKAVDSGQDRQVIHHIAERFDVSENTIRLLWHSRPLALGNPPTWHLAEILKRLDALHRRDWPDSPENWANLTADAVPAEAI